VGQDESRGGNEKRRVQSGVIGEMLSEANSNQTSFNSQMAGLKYVMQGDPKSEKLAVDHPVRRSIVFKPRESRGSIFFCV